MPNHWHFVVRPNTKHQVTRFFRWLTNTHTMRWHAHHQSQGTGHLYQGRFKAFPIEEAGYLLNVLRYAERNTLRANLANEQSWEVYGVHNMRSRSNQISWPPGRLIAGDSGCLTSINRKTNLNLRRFAKASSDAPLGQRRLGVSISSTASTNAYSTPARSTEKQTMRCVHFSLSPFFVLH